MTDSMSAVSATDRVSGPACESEPLFGTGTYGTVPYVGLKPTAPQNAAGTRIEPAPSVPTWRGPHPAPASAPAPADDPPDVRPCIQGLCVEPVSGLSPTAVHPCSGRVVVPTMIAPAARMRATSGASSRAGVASDSRDPRRVGSPVTAWMFFTVTGTPCRGPSSPPRMTASVASRAWSRAPSASRSTNALRWGSHSPMRASSDSVTSAGDHSRLRTRAAMSTAEAVAGSADMAGL